MNHHTLRRARLDQLMQQEAIDGLLISNPTATRKLMQIFEADWEESGAKDDEKDKKGTNAVTAVA